MSFQKYNLTKNGKFEASFSNKALCIFTASQRDIVTKGWAINDEPISREEMLEAQLAHGTSHRTMKVLS